MVYNFQPDVTYLGIIKVINIETSYLDTSCIVINHIRDDGHLSHYFFFSDITEDVQRFKFKMIPGQLITFKIIEVNDQLYKYHATSLNLLEYSYEFHKVTIGRKDNTILKSFCLAFSPAAIRECAEKANKELNLGNVFSTGLDSNELLNDIINNVEVKVHTWGRNKPGDDDTWAADLVTDFGKYDNDFNGYLKKNFNFSKQLFYDRGFCSYRKMLEEYENSEEYNKDVTEAVLQTNILKERIYKEYDFTAHKEAYMLEAANRKKMAVQKIYVSISSSWEFIHKNVWFLNYYDRYLKSALQIIKELQDELP